MEKFGDKPKYKEDYFFFNRAEFPSELNEAINLEIQEKIEDGYKFLVMPQQLFVQTEEQAKNWTKEGGKEDVYYDISTEEGKEAIIGLIEGEKIESWPPGIERRFRKLLEEKLEEKREKNEDKQT